MKSQAQHVIDELGGVRATAKKLGLNPGTVSRWPKPRGCKGLAGRVPAEHQEKILEIAEREGLDIRPIDLIRPRT